MGAIGEIIGAVGVLVTLGFLLHQLRQNTRALKAEGFRSTSAMIHNPTTLMIQDPELIELHARGNENYQALDPIERDRYHYLMIQRVHAIELLEQYHGAGIAEDTYAEACRLIIVRLSAKPGFQQWWGERGRHLFGPRFTQWTQSLVDANQASPLPSP
jgi:hypothetical protein